MSGLDLYVFTLKFVHVFGVEKKIKFHFYKKGIMQLLSEDAIVFLNFKFSKKF